MPSLQAPIAIFIIDLVQSYGSENYAINMANALADQGEKVDVIYQKSRPELTNQLRPSINQLKIGTHNPFATIGFLTRYFKKTPPAALYGIMEKPSLLALVAGFLSGYKNTVPTMHFDIDAYASLEYATRRKILRLLLALFYRHARAITAVSTGSAKALARWVGTKPQMKVILNGFDLNKLRAQAAESLNDPLTEKTSAPLLIACGRLIPDKGFDVLIEAFALLRKTHTARLIILGEGKELENLKDQAKEKGVSQDIIFKGFTKNPSAYFAKADIFVHASRTEGFGNVLIEAMAAGTPIISTKAPSGPEEILNYGTYGDLVPVDDSKALAAAMAKNIDNPISKDARAAIQKYLNDVFDLKTMAKTYIDLTKSLQN